jgi:hypothetical protein
VGTELEVFEGTGMELVVCVGVGVCVSDAALVVPPPHAVSVARAATTTKVRFTSTFCPTSGDDFLTT